MARIESVNSCAVRAPLAETISFSGRTVHSRDYVLVRIRSTEGIEGIGFCYAGHIGAELVVSAVNLLLSPLLINQESLDSEKLWTKIYQESLLHGRSGSIMRAFSAVDIAIWDLNARTARLPLWQYLGGTGDTAVPTYASGGYYREDKGPEDLGAELKGYVDQGFKAVKMKVGRLSLKEEGNRAAAARDAIGDDVLLMLDANNAWRTVADALAYAKKVEKYDPYWLEEPFWPDDVEAHARLAVHSPVPIATGEIEATRWRFQGLIQRRAALVLQPDAAVCGGISEFRKITDLASAHGIPVCPHWFHDLHVHLVAALPGCQFVEFFPDDSVLNFRRLINRQLEHNDGCLMLPTAPGLGFDFDENALRKWTVFGRI